MPGGIVPASPGTALAVDGAIPADAERRFERREVPYEPGRPCLIRGLPLHRIGPTPRVEPSDHRITLQGHAVRLGERWIAYW